MDYFHGIKTQISPCIAAKVKFALHLTKNKPKNTKYRSFVYWCKAIESISIQNKLSINPTEIAKNKFQTLITEHKL